MKKLLWLAAFGGLLILLVGIIGVIVVDRRYAAVFSAPRIEHGTLADEHPSVRVIINPLEASHLIQAFVSDQTQREVPRFLIDSVLPYRISIIASANHDDGEIHFHAFVNEQRLGPVLKQQFNQVEFTESFPEISWSPEGLERPSRGVLTLEGSLPMEPQAEEAVWYQWDRSIVPTPMEPEGGHLLEFFADNREGGFYLVLASLLDAYDINLDEQEQDISLTTFYFVVSARLSADLITEDRLGLNFSIEFQEGTENRVGVINLKVAIDDFIEAWQQELADQHGLVLEGQSEWDKNILTYRYELDEAARAIDLLLRGQLLGGA